MEFSHPLMDTEEYKELFKQAKQAYPFEYDYFLHIACIAHLVEVKKEEEEESYDIIKSDVIIETQDEIQEKYTSK